MTNYRSRTILYTLVAGCVLFAPTLFLRGLWSPDEPRYAEVSRQVARSDSVLIPRLNGELYGEKPPLFFYAAALGDLLWAPNGGRLVAAAAMLALALVLQRFFSPEDTTSRIGVSLIFFGCTESLVCGKFGVIDAFLVLFLVLAIYLGRKALSRPHPVGAWVGCYAALALGTLVKGPVILPFAALALVGSRSDITITAPRTKHVIGNLLGVAVFVGIVLAWLIPACVAGGGEYTEALLGQISGRITGARASHVRSWYYYLPTATFVVFPWTLLLLCSLRWAWSRKRQTMWLLLWFAGGFLLLSLFASKRDRYLFLILPAAAIVMTRYFAFSDLGRIDLLAMRVTAAFMVAAGVLLVLFGPGVRLTQYVGESRLPDVASDFLDSFKGWQLWAVCPCLGLAALGASLSSWHAVHRKRTNDFVRGIFVSVIAMSLTFDLVVTPSLDPIKTGKSFMGDVKTCAEKGVEIYLFRKDYDGRFNLDLGRDRIGVAESEDEAPALLDSEEPAALIVGYRKRPDKAIATAFAGATTLASGRLGGRTMVLLGNRSAATRFSRE